MQLLVAREAEVVTVAREVVATTRKVRLCPHQIQVHFGPC